MIIIGCYDHKQYQLDCLDGISIYTSASRRYHPRCFISNARILLCMFAMKYWHFFRLWWHKICYKIPIYIWNILNLMQYILIGVLPPKSTQMISFSLKVQQMLGKQSLYIVLTTRWMEVRKIDLWPLVVTGLHCLSNQSVYRILHHSRPLFISEIPSSVQKLALWTKSYRDDRCNLDSAYRHILHR